MKTIGGYRVVRLLGKGGMAEVYEVEHLQLGLRRAMKVFVAKGERTEFLTSRFLAACAVLLLCSQGCMAAEEPEAAVRTEPMRVTLAFERHLDDIAALEREGKIVVTDPKGGLLK